MNKKVLVIGDGGWGTAISLLLREKGFMVYVWGYDPEYTKRVNKVRANPRYLPDVPIPEGIIFTSDAGLAADNIDYIFSVIPTRYLRKVLMVFKPYIKKQIVISCTKGMEQGTFLLPSEVIKDVFGEHTEVAVLSGPSHAEEVARKKPASVVVAHKNQEILKKIKDLLFSDHFRIYFSFDQKGVELGGALKNIIAIAAGICDGLNLGDNAKSALITRGLAEISRFGEKMGGKRETFFGLSGLGDLITTCISPFGRNRSVGERLGKGEDLSLIVASMEMEAEGIWTTKAVYEKAKELGVEMPIVSSVYRILFEKQFPLDEVINLMKRPAKQEY